LEILQALAARLGAGAAFSQPDAASVWDEIRQVWGAVRGITYERLDREGGLQWPCPDEGHPGTAILHAGGFPGGKKAAFRLLDFTPSAEVADEAFPFLLNTGRSLFHFNAATMTSRTQNLRLRRDDALELHPEDALRIGVGESEAIAVTSRYGSCTLAAHLTDRVKPGEPFATFHAVRAFVNRVTGPGRDAQTGTPEYKLTAVALRRA
ncbi:MAG TPA: molybdopterin dinucleotide binding domain-containing protein, partial [Holophagaceae bacterium]